MFIKITYDKKRLELNITNEELTQYVEDVLSQISDEIFESSTFEYLLINYLLSKKAFKTEPNTEYKQIIFIQTDLVRINKILWKLILENRIGIDLLQDIGSSNKPRLILFKD